MGTWRDWFRRMSKAPSRPETKPAWASFLTWSQFQKFKRLIDEHFASKGTSFTWGDGVLLLAPASTGGLHQLGLVNLAQLCARNSEEDWANIVRDHFTTLDKSQTEQRVLEQRLPEFERVRDLLSIRLWPEDYLRELDASKMMVRRELPGVVSALVYDLPSSIRNVTPDEAKSWGQSTRDLFEIALENVAETCIPNVESQSIGDDMEVFVLSDESFFVASHALLLEDRHPECIGDFGSLVGVPHRHVLLAYPIESMAVVNVIPRLIAVIMGMEREGPGSVSPRLYWLREGEFIDLPYRLQDDTLQFSPPEAFVDVLKLLSGEDEEDEDEF